jgi:hypothetical protein
MEMLLLASLSSLDRCFCSRSRCSRCFNASKNGTHPVDPSCSIWKIWIRDKRIIQIYFKLILTSFLSDVQEGDEANTREILQQMSRLLQQESDNLWWALTTTTTTTASGSGNETTNSMVRSNNSATLHSHGHYNCGVGH